MGRRLLLAIFLGGAGGGLARAALEREWPADGHSWPWVTFAVNIAGTALLAYVVTRLGGDPLARPLVGIGFCGALTTFSTLQLEALELADNHHVALGAAYAAASIGRGCSAPTRSRAAPPEAGTVTALVWIGVGLVSGAGASPALRAPHGGGRRRAGRLPVRHARGQHPRLRDPGRAARRRRHAGTRCC